VATSRFHRPGPRYGFFSIGLSELAQTQIRSARLLAESFDVFRAMPDVDSRLLLDRQTNEAYLAYIPGEQYAVYFIDGGVVRLDLSDAQGEFTLKWLDIPNTRWTGEKSLQGGRPVEIAAPGNGHWVALIAYCRCPASQAVQQRRAARRRSLSEHFVGAGGCERGDRYRRAS
jgi:hypothetical protein